ncbi:MAG TPA: P-II family nitrogen regulator [bacterium]|nr:P-II family nitrogen regulator [bacterium]
MFKIEAVVRPDKLDSVRQKLEGIGYPGVMVTEMSGHGRQKGLHSGWPDSLRVSFLPKVKLEIVVDKKHLSAVVDAIVKGAHTGEMGDGKIFISEIIDAVRIRTGERGVKAISMVEDARRPRRIAGLR